MSAEEMDMEMKYVHHLVLDQPNEAIMFDSQSLPRVQMSAGVFITTTGPGVGIFFLKAAT